MADLSSPPYKLVGKVTTESVFKGSGKHWDKWVAILDKAGARSWLHKEIVAFLKKKYGLRPWWQQGVAMGYEIVTGRRVEGWNSKGECAVTATRSVLVNAKTVWSWIHSKDGMAVWLKPLSPVVLKPGNFFETSDGYFGELRTMRAGTRMRLSWKDPEWTKGTVLQVSVFDRPQKKTIVVFQHDGIRDAKVQAYLRKRWVTALDEMEKVLPSPAKTTAKKRSGSSRLARGRSS